MVIVVCYVGPKREMDVSLEERAGINLLVRNASLRAHGSENPSSKWWKGKLENNQSVCFSIKGRVRTATEITTQKLTHSH